MFAYLIAERYGTPFVVASKIGLGGLVFLGRPLRSSSPCTSWRTGWRWPRSGAASNGPGVKLVLVFPYAFVDTSEAWFEPRRRRIAISAAGPVSDFTLGAVFSICCLLLGAGTVRDICFQLAFAAYVGACFNLNPFLDRDGYHILVDVLREPGLRRRAREQFARRLSGGAATADSPVLARYSLCGSRLVGAGGAVRHRGDPALPDRCSRRLAPSWIVWTVMATVWIAVFVPVVIVIGKPLLTRLRGGD